MLHILDVLLKTFFPCGGVSAAYLRQSGQPGANLMPPVFKAVVMLQIPNQQRPRPNHAHIPLENIEKLGKLVQTRGAQQSAEFSQPIPVGQQIAVFIPRIGHGTEFV